MRAVGEDLVVLEGPDREAVDQGDLERAGQRGGARDCELVVLSRISPAEIDGERAGRTLRIVPGDRDGIHRVPEADRPLVDDIAQERALDQNSGAGGDFQRAAGVGQRADAGHPGAHPVVGQDIAEGRGPVDLDAVARVPADEVTDRRGAPADRVVGGAAADGDPVAAVGDGDCAGGIGADEVAGDQVAGRPRADDVDAVAGVARDDVLRPRRRTADRVRLGTRVDEDADIGVAHRDRAGLVRADEVPRHEVADRGGERDIDAVAVAADDVAAAGEVPPIVLFGAPWM